MFMSLIQWVRYQQTRKKALVSQVSVAKYCSFEQYSSILMAPPVTLRDWFDAIVMSFKHDYGYVRPNYLKAMLNSIPNVRKLNSEINKLKSENAMLSREFAIVSGMLKVANEAIKEAASLDNRKEA